MYTDEQIKEELKTTLKDGNYNKRTTFDTDFVIANEFGPDAVRDTFDRAFNEWKSNIIYLTELALVTNAFCWYYNEKNETLSELYSDFYYQCRGYVYSEETHFTKAEINYYFRCTD